MLEVRAAVRKRARRLGRAGSMGVREHEDSTKPAAKGGKEASKRDKEVSRHSASRRRSAALTGALGRRPGLAEFRSVRVDAHAAVQEKEAAHEAACETLSTWSEETQSSKTARWTEVLPRTTTTPVMLQA